MGIFGLATKKDLLDLEVEVENKDFELKKVLNQNLELNVVLNNVISSYQTTMYGWLNNGQPVQVSDNAFTYVQEGYQRNIDIYTCVHLILQKLSACTPIVYEVTKDKLGYVQKYRNLMLSDSDTARIKAKDIEVKAMKEVYMPQISDLLAKPNKYQTWTDWVMNFGGFFLLTGNGYNYYNGILPKNKKWLEMYTLPSQFMQIISGGPFQPVQGYRVMNQRFFGSDMFDFPVEQVGHLKTFNPDYTNYGSQLYGQSPLMAARLTISKNRDSRIEANKQMKNGGAMGILSPEAGAPALTSDQGKDLKEQIQKRKDSSSGELIDRIFASGGSLKWQQIGLPVAEMMLLESMDFDRKDICNIFHVPITCLNDMSASTDNNVSAHMKKLIYDAVMPLANAISDRLTRDICPAYATGDKTYVIQLDCSTLPEMQEDQGKVSEWLANSWWYTPNQKLVAQGMGESKEPFMNKIIIPSNMMLLDDLGNTDAQFTNAGGKGANDTL